MEAGGASHERNCTIISANWDPSEPTFETLNQESPKDSKQYMTVAVDLVIRGIQEPVRFLIETTVRVFGQNERNFWYFQRRTLTQQFFLNLKEVSTILPHYVNKYFTYSFFILHPHYSLSYISITVLNFVEVDRIAFHFVITK